MKRVQEIDESIHLLIVGYGKAEGLVINWIKSGVLQNTSFINRKVPQTFLADILRSADYALSSIDPYAQVYYDTCVPNKIYEALCTGIPVLSFQGRSIENLTQRMSGIINFDLLRKDISIEDISQVICRLNLTSFREKKKLSREAMALFSYKVLSKRFRAVLEEVLARRRHKNGSRI